VLCGGGGGGVGVFLRVFTIIVIIGIVTFATIAAAPLVYL